MFPWTSWFKAHTERLLDWDITTYLYAIVSNSLLILRLLRHGCHRWQVETREEASLLVLAVYRVWETVFLIFTGCWSTSQRFCCLCLSSPSGAALGLEMLFLLCFVFREFWVLSSCHRDCIASTLPTESSLQPHDVDSSCCWYSFCDFLGISVLLCLENTASLKSVLPSE